MEGAYVSKSKSCIYHAKLRLDAMKSFIWKLDRLLTTMAYAEAGDLDTVKKRLQEDSSKMENAIPSNEAQQMAQQHSSCA